MGHFHVVNSVQRMSWCEYVCQETNWVTISDVTSMEVLEERVATALGIPSDITLRSFLFADDQKVRIQIVDRNHQRRYVEDKTPQRLHAAPTIEAK